MNALRLALVQMRVGPNKQENIAKALMKVKEAARIGAHAVCLPECFNSPYGTQHFAEYAEEVPHGNTCQQISQAAKENNIWVLAGSIPERGKDGKLYNTHASYGPDGNLVGVFRKLHLFDIDIPGKITFRESESLNSGNSLLSFTMSHPAVDDGKSSINVGIGICYDVRFPELAQIYSMQRDCQLLVYPGAFNMTTGPAHWELLARARTVDNQCFVALCSPARDPQSGYTAWGHSMVVGPWGDIMSQASADEATIVADLEMQEVTQFRRNIPIREQRRKDIYSLAKEN